MGTVQIAGVVGSARLRWRCLSAAALLILAPMATSATGSSQSSGSKQEITQRREDLDDLRRRIERLKTEVLAGESARNEAADQLRSSESEISRLQRRLYELSNERELQIKKQQELLSRATVAERQLAQQQGRLDGLLVQQYMFGNLSPLRLLLSGQNPNQTARDLMYLGMVGQARQEVVQETTELIEENRRLAEETRQQAEALAAIEIEQKTRQAEMVSQREQRVKMLAAISTKVAAQRREIDTLRRDEQRLARLIERLSKMLAQKPKPARPKAAKERRPSGSAPADASAGTAFAALKGKLPAPANGSLTTRFGGALEGGGKSKGMFLRAPTGAEVRSVAAGQVVFADWLRGFGNLIVIDHGEGFLTVYGQNEALLAQVGDDVKTGQRIAAVGNSGGRAESGLYFELRRQGEAIDPGPWLRK